MFSCNKTRARLLVTFIFTAIWSSYVFSESGSAERGFANCIVKQIEQAPADKPIGEIGAFCRKEVIKADMNVDKIGIIGRKIIEEKQAEWNRHVITGHKQNYILPYSYSSNPNRDVYSEFSPWGDFFRQGEAIFQLSYKVPLNTGNLLRKYDGLYFGMTLKSWWQLYAAESSRPFRETNYEPELFYLTPLRTGFAGGNLGIMFGLSHQSNGQSQALSRSWNRIYTGLMYDKNDFGMVLKTWYRIPEDEKESPLDPKGDDNPDIEDYMGNFNLTAIKRFGINEISVMVRNNLSSDNRGAVEVGYSFPLPRKSHIKGFVNYFGGYGDSLIDYDHYQERFGIGILLTDLL